MKHLLEECVKHPVYRRDEEIHFFSCKHCKGGHIASPVATLFSDLSIGIHCERPDLNFVCWVLAYEEISRCACRRDRLRPGMSTSAES